MSRNGQSFKRATIATLLAGVALVALAARGGEVTMQHARGEFDVKLKPLALDGPAEDASLSRMSLEKDFRGDLTATGQGQMLAFEQTAYVAIERVTGSLAGKKGSFGLQHRGVMNEEGLLITVVPGSGTGELTGLTGKLSITIEGGKHLYDLEYTLPAAPESSPR